MIRSSDIHFGNGFKPFRTTKEKPDPVRPLSGPEGVADRLRLVAFAELQARDIFLYGIDRFAGEAHENWLDAWKRFAAVEDRHAQILLTRMEELKIEIPARAVSDKLTRLCRRAENPVDFLFLLSSAEERGMEAGFILGKEMLERDPMSAALFKQIADEEVEHVAMAREALSAYDLGTLKEKAKEINRNLEG